jgi:hypothetical protein
MGIDGATRHCQCPYATTFTRLVTARMSLRTVLLCVLLTSVAAPGCVRRRLTVRSQPAGATVYIDDQEIGETPVSTPFTYYGTRKIQLVKDGHETLTVKQRFKTPWYQIPPLDFFSENLITTELRDERIVDFELEPQRVVPVEELLGRAQELRQNTQAGYTVAPPPVATSAPTPVPLNTPPAGDPFIPPPFYP